MAVLGSSKGGGGQRDEGAVKPDLLDFLFTLALAIGLAPEFVGGEGLLAYNWRLTIPSYSFIFDILVFGLGLATLLFSWYGFNHSVSQKPVLYGSLAGLLRFSLDAILVLLYGFLLIQYRNFGVFFATLIFIFIIYTIWDALKIIEYRLLTNFDGSFGSLWDNKRNLINRTWERESMKYLVGHVLLFLIYVFALNLDIYVTAISTVVLFLLYILTFHYRACKMGKQLSADEEKICRYTNGDE